MKHQLRSSICTEGRRMAGARALWVATGMKREQFGKPIIAIVNSFTQFVPGHTHLHEIGQIVREEIEKLGCYAAEFNTIAIDDGIAMGHDGMLYSLPSRDIIADSVEYMVNAHKADAMIHAPEHPCRLCERRPYGGRTLAWRECRPHYRYGEGCRPRGQRQRPGRAGTVCLSWLRFLLRHVYSQLHELAHRGHRSLVAWQRHHRSHTREPHKTFQGRRKAHRQERPGLL